MKTPRGIFVSMEGGEGTGKTTQIRMLESRLVHNGVQLLVTRQPGGTVLGTSVRTLLVQRTADPPTARAELFLYAADRAHHVDSVLRPALDVGCSILCDRYADSTTAYQGYARGLPMDLVGQVNDLAVDGLWPDRTILLDIDVRKGLGRSLDRHSKEETPEDRFERLGGPFHERVRQGFLSIAHAEPERVKVVSALGSPDEVHERVWNAIRDLWGL